MRWIASGVAIRSTEAIWVSIIARRSSSLLVGLLTPYSHLGRLARIMVRQTMILQMPILIELEWRLTPEWSANTKSFEPTGRHVSIGDKS